MRHLKIRPSIKTPGQAACLRICGLLYSIIPEKFVCREALRQNYRTYHYPGSHRIKQSFVPDSHILLPPEKESVFHPYQESAGYLGSADN